jgi:ubiquinone/menaquinone biosynthesis C-methylase UbiE
MINRFLFKGGKMGWRIDMGNDWKVWNQDKAYGEIMYKRAIGELPEMESSKSLRELIRPLYHLEMKIIDVGCGSGHYLRSLRELDPKIDYTGLDSTPYYIELARKAFHNFFIVGDIYNLAFKDGIYEMALCSNLLLHLPTIKRALSELIRVSSRYIIARTLIGEFNYVIKQVRNFNNHSEEDLIDRTGNPTSFNYLNIYTEQYIREVIKTIDKRLHVEIIKDNNWQKFDNTELGMKAGTRILGNKQVSGNIIFGWRYIVIDKELN